MYSVQKMVDDSTALCSQKFAFFEIDLQVVSEIDMEIPCHPVAIGQVLLNILNNAFHEICKEGRDEKWIRVTLKERSDFIEIAISDSGGGIPEAIRDKIFQPFFTSKDVGEGTGLGLSLSKGIIESHRGKLFLDTKRSHTTFIIELPKEAEQLAA
jgi:signal transduction histidine kinase